MMSKHSRREFIGTTALAGAAALMTGPAKLLAASHRPIPIGVQLYSLRNTFPKDIPGTLAGVKKLGPTKGWNLPVTSVMRPMLLGFVNCWMTMA